MTAPNTRQAESILKCKSLVYGGAERLKWNSDSVTYLCFQQEVCPETGRSHYQCYIQFKRKCKHTAICKLLTIPKNAYHAEVARGSPQQNADYCSKEDTRAPGTTPMIFGTLDVGEQGKRCVRAALSSMSLRF